MPLPKEKAWFAAKRYGWGWGFPLRWEGWAALAVFIAALITGSAYLKANGVAFAVFAGVLCVAMIALCVWKGEVPKWRWGNDD